MNERDTLRELLYGVRCHLHILHALEGLDPRLAGGDVEGAPHTIFQILHHMVYWQGFALHRMRGEHPPDPAHAAEGSSWGTRTTTRSSTSTRCASTTP